MIPQEKSAAVTLGLNEAFGVTEFEDIRDLTERPGSNRAFRIVVRGSAYLLRINTRAGDMTRHFTCMQAAADAGLAPRVWYTRRRGSDLHHRFCGGCAFIRGGRAGSDSRRAADPARAAAVSRIPLQYHLHVPAELRTCPGRIPPEVPGVEHSAGKRDRGTSRSLPASGRGLLASRSGPGAES